MKIFITGVAGFLGSHLADALISEGHEVCGCDNLMGGELSNIPADVDYSRIDCTDFLAMKEVLYGVRTVIHCAALAPEGFSTHSPNIISYHTLQATVTTLSAAAAQGVKNFIFCSSMARYGKNKVPFTEDMSLFPVDPYGIAKVAAEEFVRNICRTYNMNYVIVVPHNIIGTRQKYDDPYRNVVSIFINRILLGKQPIIFGDGEQKRCFSVIWDCIRPLVKIVKDVDKLNGEVFNIGPDEISHTRSINMLCRMICDEMNVRCRPLYVSDRVAEVKMAYCSSEKARKVLGYTTRYTLPECIKEMIIDIRAKGARQFRYHLPIEINERCPEVWLKKLI